MATARAALNLPAASAPAREGAAEFLKRVAQIDATRCPHCALGRWRTLATGRPANANYATKAANAANAANAESVANAKAQVPRRGPP